jgi:5-(carboxyamino)imidazole ribonucleotide mutase
MGKALVGIIMGSDSDLPVLKEAAEILEEFGVPFEINVLSAHRSPNKTHEYVKSAKEKGLKIIIASAGMAAHLAGAAAANTTLPVIGVPVMSKSLDGLDALLSTVQMPPGIPVATVAINGAKNAGILAVEILATSDEKLSEKLEEYKKGLEANVLKKNEKLTSVGFKKYLEESAKK